MLIDFGVSSAFGSPPAPNLDKSLAYWAPERLTFAAATPATDLYSFGVLIYYCLTKRLPFEPSFDFQRYQMGEEVLAPEVLLAQYHREQDPPPLNQQDIPSSVEVLVRALLAKAPQHRPADISEVLNILQNPYPATDQPDSIQDLNEELAEPNVEDIDGPAAKPQIDFIQAPTPAEDLMWWQGTERKTLILVSASSCIAVISGLWIVHWLVS